jgi:hypothetical protein
MKKSLLLVVIGAFMAMPANAAFLVEPYLGMHFNSEAEDADADISGMGIGARVGYQNLGLMLGLNYKSADLEFEPDNSAISNYDVEQTHYGVFVGYEFPILIRAWVEYVIGGSAEFKTGDYDSISGTQLGVGYTGLPFVSLNLEIGNLTYEDGPTGFTDQDISTYMLSVSLPLTL